MGSDSICIAHFQDRTSDGRAMLESTEIIFRGDFRLQIPLDQIRSVDSSDGVLSVVWEHGAVEFELGPKADIWAARIRNPKSRLDKLGVKPGLEVAVLRVDDDAFEEELAERGIQPGRLRKGANLVFYGAGDLRELDGLERIAKSITADGAIWVVYQKGGAVPTESQVLDAGRRAGLVDTKVVSFSPTHTALKFVIPRSARG